MRAQREKKNKNCTAKHAEHSWYIYYPWSRCSARFPFVPSGPRAECGLLWVLNMQVCRREKHVMVRRHLVEEEKKQRKTKRENKT